MKHQNKNKKMKGEEDEEEEKGRETCMLELRKIKTENQTCRRRKNKPRIQSISPQFFFLLRLLNYKMVWSLQRQQSGTVSQEPVFSDNNNNNNR